MGGMYSKFVRRFDCTGLCRWVAQLFRKKNAAGNYGANCHADVEVPHFARNYSGSSWDLFDDGTYAGIARYKPRDLRVSPQKTPKTNKRTRADANDEEKGQEMVTMNTMKKMSSEELLQMSSSGGKKKEGKKKQSAEKRGWDLTPPKATKVGRYDEEDKPEPIETATPETMEVSFGSDTETVVIQPDRLEFTEEGGFRIVTVQNTSDQRKALKLKSSNNTLLRANPVYAFLEPKQTVHINVYRGKSASRKAEQIVVLLIEANHWETDPQNTYAVQKGMLKKRNKIKANQTRLLVPIVTVDNDGGNGDI